MDFNNKYKEIKPFCPKKLLSEQKIVIPLKFTKKIKQSISLEGSHFFVLTGHLLHHEVNNIDFAIYISLKFF